MEIHNWISDFLKGHSHCTRFSGEIPSPAHITASIIQGSGLGPAAYIVTVADLHPLHASNAIIKFADDTYLIIPAASSNSCADEASHIKVRAAANNLRLNCTKSKEIIVRARSTWAISVQPVELCRNIERTNKLTVLGVVINDRFTATDHVSSILVSCSSLLYALRVLRRPGLQAQSCKDIFHATVIGKIMYCALARSGFYSAADIRLLTSFLRRCEKLEYQDRHSPSVTETKKLTTVCFEKCCITKIMFFDNFYLNIVIFLLPQASDS